MQLYRLCSPRLRSFTGDTPPANGYTPSRAYCIMVPILENITLRSDTNYGVNIITKPIRKSWTWSTEIFGVFLHTLLLVLVNI